MLPTRWDPFRDVVSLQDRMNRLLRDWPVRGEEPTWRWAPPVDILETDDSLVVRAELPGMKAEEIEVSVENGTLTLSGERKTDARYDDQNVHRVESQYGAFARSFTLPTRVDPARVKATFRDGVLEIELPKAEDAKPRRVQIQA